MTGTELIHVAIGEPPSRCDSWTLAVAEDAAGKITALVDALCDLVDLVQDGYQHNDIAMTRALNAAKQAIGKTRSR